MKIIDGVMIIATMLLSCESESVEEVEQREGPGICDWPYERARSQNEVEGSYFFLTLEINGADSSGIYYPELLGLPDSLKGLINPNKLSFDGNDFTIGFCEVPFTVSGNVIVEDQQLHWYVCSVLDHSIGAWEYGILNFIKHPSYFDLSNQSLNLVNGDSTYHLVSADSISEKLYLYQPDSSEQAISQCY